MTKSLEWPGTHLKLAQDPVGESLSSGAMRTSSLASSVGETGRKPTTGNCLAAELGWGGFEQAAVALLLDLRFSHPQPGYLLVGLLAVLMALETAYRLQEVQAFVSFFGPTQDLPSEDSDRLEILPRDQLALSTVSGGSSQEGPAEPGAT